VDLAYDEVIVDYREDIEDVYSSLVRAATKATKRVDILGLCCRRQQGIVR